MPVRVLYAEATDELGAPGRVPADSGDDNPVGQKRLPGTPPLRRHWIAGHHRWRLPFLRRADVVLGLGCSFAKSGFAVPIPAGKTLIHATNDPDDINKDHPCRYPLVGDAKLVLAQLWMNYAGRPEPQAVPVNQALTEEIASVKQAWLAKWLPKLTADEDPINPYRVVWDLMHGGPRQRHCHRIGSIREQLVPFWEARHPRSFIGWGKSTQLGYSLGLAMGAKLAAPEKDVIHMMGDAAFGMVGMDVETAVRAHSNSHHHLKQWDYGHLS